MTEAEWLAATDPTRMLEFLGGRASDRKLRLFAAACCRPIFPFILDKTCGSGLQAAERFADGAISRDDFERAFQAVVDAGWKDANRRRKHRNGVATPSQSGHDHEAVRATFFSPDATFNKILVTLTVGSNSAAMAEGWGSAGRNIDAEETAITAQSHLLRDIFGNPFSPVSIDPTWLTPTVLALAATIYAERATALLPILGDALEDAGCPDAAMLAHCRAQGAHVRGCWVVDLLLGRE